MCVIFRARDFFGTRTLLFSSNTNNTFNMATIDPSYSLRDAEAELAKLDAEEQDFHSMLANHDPAYDGELLPEELADLHSAQRARSKRMDALLQHISVLQSSTPDNLVLRLRLREL